MVPSALMQKLSDHDFDPSGLKERFSTENVSLALLVIIGIAISLLGLQLFRTWWPLRHIPGPFLAKFTNFQRMSWVWTKRAHLILQDLHEKHGPLVRIGPNLVSFDDPEAIPTVYPMRPGFPKSKFYRTLQAYSRSGGALPAVFNTQDEVQHKQIKSPIAPLFSVSSAASMEPLVNDVLEAFQEKMDGRFATTTEVFDLGQWLQYFAFDVMGTMTFSKRYGFIDQGRDVKGMLDTIVFFMRSAAPFTQIPWLDKVLNKNIFADTIRQYIRRTASLTILRFVNDAIKEKREKLAEAKIEAGDEIEGRKDFLTRYVEIQSNNPNIPPWAPTAWTFSNVIAGSDSVGTVMRTVMLNLLSYPHTLAKLHDELREAGVSRPIPSFTEIRELPYLDACVHEASRMHPPFALPFERVVPPAGIEIFGTHLPGGTVVGGSPYVVNRHKGGFGQDAEFWRPERWLEKDDAHKRKLEQSVLTFGAGRRVCMGKNVGLFEVKKIVSFLVLNYDIRIIDRERFQVENSWFFFQRGLYAQIKKRAEENGILVEA